MTLTCFVVVDVVLMLDVTVVVVVGAEEDWCGVVEVGAAVATCC